MGITIIYCAVDGCDHILASSSLRLSAFCIGHRVDNNDGTHASHAGGLFLRVDVSSVDQLNYETIDDYHEALRKAYPKKDKLPMMTDE
jgi:hypothetical protein